MNRLLRWLAKWADNRSLLFRAYYVRYLPPKEAGVGEIVFVCSGRNLTLPEIRDIYPQVFTDEGTYTLSIATGETLTVNKDKK